MVLRERRPGQTSEYELSTGRRFHANGGLLSPGDDGSLFEGYDGTVWCVDWDLDDETVAFTQAERVEIADFMIEKWQQWKRGGHAS